mmetsp:Transcript_40220/g.92462  ORF Transcript_40220/g.92462 Transcript_40220/m.92462 type:complete len:184 (-) Transcript_40220:56-607(-)
MGGKCCCQDQPQENGSMADVVSHKAVLPMVIDAGDDGVGGYVPAAQQDDSSDELWPDSGLPSVDSRIGTAVGAEGSAAVAKNGSLSVDSPFVAHLDLQAQGGKVGIAVGQRHGVQQLEVVKVHDIGAIPEWNKLHPDKVIYPGCAILTVDDEKMLPKPREELALHIATAFKRDKLRMEIQRPL